MTVVSFARRHSAILAGLIAQAVQYGSALAMLPILITHLTPAEIGIWYLFIAIQGLALIADFGFQPTFARNFALAYAGVASLQAQGTHSDVRDEPNWPLFHAILQAARRVYFGLSAGIFALLAVAGLLYVRGVTAQAELDLTSVSISWIIFSFGVCLHLYFLWISPLLIGLNRMRTNYLFQIIARGGFAVIGIVVLLAGGRLIALSIVLVVTDLIGRLLLVPTLRPILARLRDSVPAPGQARAAFLALLPNAVRTGIVGIAAYMIVRASAFIVTPFLGIAMMASYGTTMQLVAGLQAIALLPTQVQLPAMVRAHVQHDRVTLRRQWRQVTLIYLLLFGTGALVLVLFSEPVLTSIGSRIQLIPQTALAALCIITALEGIHTVAAAIIQASNRVPFVWPAVLSGVGVILLGTTAAWVGFGILGIIVAQGIVQAAYNNWKWPLMVLRELRA